MKVLLEVPVPDAYRTWSDHLKIGMNFKVLTNFERKKKKSFHFLYSQSSLHGCIFLNMFHKINEIASIFDTFK